MTDANAAAPRSQRLIDEATGQPVQLVYAIPPELFAGPGQSDRGDGIAWIDLVQRVWRRRLGMVVIFAVACLTAVTLALTAGSSWTATVTAIPPTAKGGLGASLGQYSDLASLAGIALPGGGGSPVEEIMAILESRTLHARLVERFDLMAHYRSKMAEDATRTFDDQFTTAYNKKSGTVSFSYCTRIGTPQIPDQVKLAEIVNAAAVELQAIYNRIHQSASHREREFLEGRLAHIQDDYARAQVALADFQRENRTVQLESQVKATVEAISALEGQMIGQQVELRALLASQASADNPSIQLLKERISALNETIKRLSGSGAPGEDGDVLLRLGSLPQIGIEYVNLLREVKKNEAILQALTAQVEAARFNELRNSEVINIIDPAVPPQRRTSPKRASMCLIGALLGAISALAWGLLADPVLSGIAEVRAALSRPPRTTPS